MRKILLSFVFWCELLLYQDFVSSFYLPGINPISFSKGDPVKLKVNKMTSHKMLYPVDYYRLPFCQPEGGPVSDAENLGELLAGDRIESSPYRLRMKEDMYCEQVCVADLGVKEKKGVKRANTVVGAIRRSYHNNWIVDNLSSASKLEDEEFTQTKYWEGFPIGYVGDDSFSYIHNHVNLEIMFHPVETETEKFRVVRFTVEPFSIQHSFQEINNEEDLDSSDSVVAKITDPIASCTPNSHEHTDFDMIEKRNPQLASGKVLFTYDVIWKQNDEVRWASRWDIYLNMNDEVPSSVHWMNIINALLVVIILSAMIALVLVRNLRRDISRYNRLATDAEKAEEMEELGWKLVHADVFRPPSTSPLLLSVSCGTGAQLLCMTLLTIVFSGMGFLSPANRGALLMAQLLFYVLMGVVAGYVNARVYKTFKGKNWQKATVFTSMLFPGMAFVIFFILNITAWIEGSTDAVPFTTMIVLLFLWFGISSPLVSLGAYYGYKEDAIEFPVDTSSIPRQIPDQPWYMSYIVTILISGILPFGSCFVEVYYILSSIWREQYYYVFGVLLVVFLILIVTCAEISILLTYIQLSGEDYRWWWRSFSTGGSPALYFFMYSIIYFQSLEANTFATYILYFGYMGLVCVASFLVTGCVGLFSALWFNKIIFGSIKID